ncbi:envelope stress response membrane protein PspB [Rheinheimera muenzenbergensis]|uniref:Envelope stress response membrane protein PspB n=1 Tax=Rheinheimera muenzenbergensis TaxID=1193628 RepID=A0ABU8C7R0_9GAMM|nr:envelope stress response membrane protein PspB [Gammaproteobacteria bacterium]MBU1554189.1 envelope stress response membrane protein PspB [Gammaproteobacteria bacterium]MBU2071097.1 envelope stress response membrane protein PspB [Gammaproteobacteria bacterium]MBU2184922.1 envelope stress response membrane protein PspB [Gammaproteobacteria bacterium]MBU2204458.1 envelope stress response membrane protein PspB [Gammaproteobacteria bacterium]
MEISEVIGIPFILFMIFVAPIWVIMHYRSKNKMGQGLSDQELTQLNDLAQRAEKMADRIKTLEAILDAESPNWRSQHD